jgi:uncharacterized protein (DUF2235 family)
MKRIVICADGTWNVRDQKDPKTGKRHATNVTKLARAVKPRSADGIDQIVYYHDGVGTRWGLDRISGGAFGVGIESNLRELYRFIAYNYVTGDEIYLFGFSRGAFTVRTLTGFMNKVGLVEKGDDFCVPELYACYHKSVAPGDPAWITAFKNVRTPRSCPPIKFVGVWDTVGALGAPGFIGQLFNRGRFKFHDVTLNPNIQNAAHAMAIDEHRKPFTPNIWSKPPDWKGNLIQAWFAGVHCNVGGGYSPDGLANEALHWMASQARVLGLELDDEYLLPFRPCFNSDINESMTMFYRLLGFHLRPIGEHRADDECVHQSVLDRYELQCLRYAPKNLAPMVPDKSYPPAVTTPGRAQGVPCGVKQEQVSDLR